MLVGDLAAFLRTFPLVGETGNSIVQVTQGNIHRNRLPCDKLSLTLSQSFQPPGRCVFVRVHGKIELLG
jgi:hypothetical protein